MVKRSPVPVNLLSNKRQPWLTHSFLTQLSLVLYGRLAEGLAPGLKV